MAQKSSKQTYISLDEITSQHSMIAAESTSYHPLDQNEHDDWLPVHKKKTWFRMDKSWKSIVAAGAATAGLVLLLNLAFFIWTVATEGLHGASVTIFMGAYHRAADSSLYLSD